MIVIKKGLLVELDIHGMYAQDAKREIERYLSNLSPKVQEVVIIHGYKQGQALKDMVRTRLKHPRIAKKLITLNEGQTTIIIKNE